MRERENFGPRLRIFMDFVSKQKAGVRSRTKKGRPHQTLNAKGSATG